MRVGIPARNEWLRIRLPPGFSIPIVRGINSLFKHLPDHRDLSSLVIRGDSLCFLCPQKLRSFLYAFTGQDFVPLANNSTFTEEPLASFGDFMSSMSTSTGVPLTWTRLSLISFLNRVRFGSYSDFLVGKTSCTLSDP